MMFKCPKPQHLSTVVSLFFTLLLSVCFSTNCIAGFASPKSINKNHAQLSKKAGIDLKVFELALKAHKKAYQEGLTKSNMLTVIDYSKPSTEKRFWVIDLNTHRVVFHTYVAHGSGSGDNLARSFSNKPGSYQSSIGTFITGDTYRGRHGISLNLIGLEAGINNNAYNRRIVIHSAHYVDEKFIKRHGRLGRSWGCPALSNQIAQPVINTIKNGVLLFAYFPEPYWLAHSRYIG